MSKKQDIGIEDLQGTPWTGISGFFTDLDEVEENRVAIESFQHNGSKTPTSGDVTLSAVDPGPDTTVVYKKNDQYHVFFKISELMSGWNGNLTSFSSWLTSLQENDVVYIHQTGSVWNLTSIVQILGVLSTECKAKKVFVVDHLLSEALFMLVCDEIVVTPMGAVTFQNNLNIDRTRWDLIYTPYLKSLYAKAIDKKFLTEEEVENIIYNNAIVFKTYNQLVSSGAVA